MNMVETIKAGESETTEFKTSLAEGGCGSLPAPLTIPLCTITPAAAGRGAAVCLAHGRLFC